MKLKNKNERTNPS